MKSKHPHKLTLLQIDMTTDIIFTSLHFALAGRSRLRQRMSLAMKIWESKKMVKAPMMVNQRLQQKRKSLTSETLSTNWRTLPFRSCHANSVLTGKFSYWFLMEPFRKDFSLKERNLQVRNLTWVFDPDT